MAWTLDSFRASRRPGTLAAVYDAHNVDGPLPPETPVSLYDWPGADGIGAYVVHGSSGFMVELAARGVRLTFRQQADAEAYLFGVLTDEKA